MSAPTGKYPFVGKETLEEIGKDLLSAGPEAKWWSETHVEQHPDGDWYLLIPGNGFVLHLRMDEVGSIDGFLEDTSGG